MTENDDTISRRNVLAGLGAIGAGGALVGAGTSAFFSDEQQLPNRMVAGQLELSVDFQEYYDFGKGRMPIDAFPDTKRTPPGVKDREFYEKYVCEDKLLREDPLESKKYRTDNEWTDPGDPLINLDDIKPGDCGEVTLSYHLCDNDGWIWFRTKNKEYPDDPEELHLVDAIQARVWYDEYEDEEIERGDNVYQEGKEPVIAQGSLRDVLEELNETNGGTLLDPDPVLDPNADGEVDCRELETIDDSLEDVDDVQQYLRDLFASYQEQGQGGDHIELEGDQGEKIRIWITGLVYQDANDPTSDVVGFDWKSNYGICQTRVKGGPDDPRGGEFAVENCTFEGTAVAPLGAAQGTKRYGVSNFQFWYCKGVKEPKDPECFEASTTHYLGFEWCLPKEIGNEVQRDELAFDFGFYTEQCRHNDDPQNPWVGEYQVRTGSDDWSQTSYEKAFGMETLWGSSSRDLNQTPHEIKIHPALSVAEARHDFSPAGEQEVTVPFQATYDPADDGTATFTIDGVTVEDDDIEGNAEKPGDGEIALTARSLTSDGHPGDVSRLERLEVNGTNITSGIPVEARYGDPGLSWIVVSGVDFDHTVTVSGDLTMEVDEEQFDTSKYKASPGLGIDWK